jgi:hypothetical protein
MESDETYDYHSFLLRMRRVWVDGRSVWRFSLQSPGEANYWKFPTLAAIVAFLHQLMQEPELNPGQSPKSDRDEKLFPSEPG